MGYGVEGQEVHAGRGRLGLILWEQQRQPFAHKHTQKVLDRLTVGVDEYEVVGDAEKSRKSFPNAPVPAADAAKMNGGRQ